MAGLVVGLSVGGMVVAAPARAGCEPRPMGVTYCDGPVQADGSWRRCFTNSATFWPSTAGGVFVPSGGNCYNVPGPGQDPFPWAPQEWLVGTG